VIRPGEIREFQFREYADLRRDVKRAWLMANELASGRLERLLSPDVSHSTISRISR
jgi:hypothetical protein